MVPTRRLDNWGMCVRDEAHDGSQVIVELWGWTARGAEVRVSFAITDNDLPFLAGILHRMIKARDAYTASMRRWMRGE